LQKTFCQRARAPLRQLDVAVRCRHRRGRPSQSRRLWPPGALHYARAGIAQTRGAPDLAAAADESQQCRLDPVRTAARVPRFVHSRGPAPAARRARVAGGAEEPLLARRVRSRKRRPHDAHAARRQRRTRTRSRRLSLRLRKQLCSPARTPRCRSSSIPQARRRLRGVLAFVAEHKNCCSLVVTDRANAALRMRMQLHSDDERACWLPSATRTRHRTRRRPIHQRCRYPQSCRRSRVHRRTFVILLAGLARWRHLAQRHKATAGGTRRGPD
jgi:hypothetical protein